MPRFDSNEFAAVAAELLACARGGEPAFVRTALTRSYYSQYGHLRQRIEAMFGDCFRNRAWHSQLCEVCRDSREKHVRRIGVRLSELLKLRQDADYFPERELHRQEAENALDMAQDLREAIRNLSEQDITAIHDELLRLIAHVEAGSLRRRF